MTKRFKVDYLRDGLTEEFHTGVVQYGEENTDITPYYLRSCAKPLQACLLLDYGIDLTPKELAFCSGSHAGENCHVEIAKEILNKLRLNESYLKCGIHAPLSRTMQDKMLLNGEKTSQIHNNCSGKHLGFLAICKQQGWDLDTYYEPEHPLQKEVKRKIYELCEITDTNSQPSPSKREYNKLKYLYPYPMTTDGCGGVNKSLPEIYPMTTDGCGVPIVSMPLGNLVKGYINLNKKYPELVNAILQNPYIYGGENRLDTEIIQKSDGLLAKVGAGGLCVVLNAKKNEAFAVKMNDANTEARRFAVFEIINSLNWAKVEIDRTIKTLNGKIVGEVVVTIDK